MDAAGVALGAVALFPIVLELFKAVTSLRGFAERSVILLRQLDLEREVLRRWGKEVGLSGEIDGPGNKCLIPSDLLPIVQEITEAIGHLLAKATVADNRPPRTAGNASTLSDDLRKLKFEGEQRRTTETLRQAFRRLRWAISEESQLRELIYDIHRYNNGLHNLVPKPVQARLDGLLLQGILSKSDRDELREVRDASEDLRQDLSAAANVTLIRESLEAIPHPLTVNLMLPRSSFDSISKDMSRYVTTYRHMVGCSIEELLVMIEWRRYKCESSAERKDRFLATCLDLARLLHASRNLAAYRTMDCLGIIDDKEFAPDHRVGLVYRAPITMETTIQSPVSAAVNVRTLNDLINSKTFSLPELGQRFRLAQSLSIGLHRILVSRWFHKNMNSRNVLFFEEKQTTSIADPFLSGFDYARPDSPEHETIKPDEDEFCDRYRHPSYADPVTRREIRYSRSFDIYSFGVILVEIGYWETAETIHKKRKERHGQNHARSSTLADLQAHLRTKCIDSLGFRMGRIYADAAKLCLGADDTLTGCDEESLLSAFNNRVVSELAKCNA